MSFANEILDAIEIIVKQVVEDNTTKIYTGVCKAVSDSVCRLSINGKENTVKYYGGTPIVGVAYQVFVPFGNMSAAFIIIPGSDGGNSGTTDAKVNRSGDTMTGVLVAQNNANYTMAQVRNIIISTADPSGGNEGDIWIKYTP